VPDADLELGLLDIADLGSVHCFAAQILENQQSPDLLVNNAGVMGVPQRNDHGRIRAAVRHQSPRVFALTGLLLPGLLTPLGVRVVTVSSLAQEQAGSSSTTCGKSTAMDAGPPTPSPSWGTCCSRLNSIARPGRTDWTSSAWRYTRA
jgi:NADP-dependent 3-hydroxy acid dehydrogenase YdfG